MGWIGMRGEWTIQPSGRVLYEQDLARRQQEHLARVRQMNWQPCAHDNCPYCIGTGVKSDGSPCVHMLYCGCPKHGAYGLR